VSVATLLFVLPSPAGSETVELLTTDLRRADTCNRRITR
jgi:hypothetical protein